MARNSNVLDGNIAAFERRNGRQGDRHHGRQQDAHPRWHEPFAHEREEADDETRPQEEHHPHKKGFEGQVDHLTMVGMLKKRSRV